MCKENNSYLFAEELVKNVVLREWKIYQILKRKLLLFAWICF